MVAFGSRIDFRTKARVFPVSVLSRFGPTVALVPAAVNVWQAPQPAERKTPLPRAAPISPPIPDMPVIPGCAGGALAFAPLPLCRKAIRSAISPWVTVGHVAAHVVERGASSPPLPA